MLLLLLLLLLLIDGWLLSLIFVASECYMVLDAMNSLVEHSIAAQLAEALVETVVAVSR